MVLICLGLIYGINELISMLRGIVVNIVRVISVELRKWFNWYLVGFIGWV